VITAEQIEDWLSAREDEHVEFKAARRSFSFDDLVSYCAALANEGGGHIVLGISPRLPRRVVGSQAFRDLPATVERLLQRVRLRIRAEEVQHSGGRLVVFSVPPRPVGSPIGIGGKYWMRAGESLTGMTADMLKRIFDEAVPDFTAQICADATLADLDADSVERFWDLWSRKSGNPDLAKCSPEQLLADAELVTDGAITHAALVLMGTHQALGRHLANAEVVFEYRSSEAPGPANQRVEFRQGFLGYFDELWDLINLRNDRQSYRDGLLVQEIATFNEGACREAVLNAVSHRDYRHGGSVFVRQYARRLVVESPGGFPAGITLENLLYRQHPRNRRLADALARCGFVERAGQGADLMFRTSIQEGKARPDFTHTDEHGVFLTLHGEVRDPQFVRFLEEVSAETGLSFGINELLALAHVHDDEPVSTALAPEVKALLQAGVVERVSRGKLVLSRRLYRFVGRPGEYTRRRGLDHETNKELLLAHIKDAGASGAPMAELAQVLPAKSKEQIRRLLHELRREGRVHKTGLKRGTRWLPGPDPAGDNGAKGRGDNRKAR